MQKVHVLFPVHVSTTTVIQPTQPGPPIDAAVFGKDVPYLLSRGILAPAPASHNPIDDSLAGVRMPAPQVAVEPPPAQPYQSDAPPLKRGVKL